MFKMDMVWKKRNKTGGLQSRHRPMRNHEMVYFFYEQAPKYNRDKYHKRIQAKKEHNIEKEEKPKKKLSDKTIYGCNTEARHGKKAFEPPNPASVVEEKTTYGISKEECKNSIDESVRYNGNNFEPPNPASVLEEKYTKEYLHNKQKTIGTGGSEMRGIFSKENIKKYNKENGVGFEPPNPASVISEAEREETKDVWGETKFSCGGDCGRLNEDGTYKMPYDPPNPPSVFESTKVFIGKRHHQTEKPQDILEFFIKYWSDPGQTILDPTMGSGSTGVACKTLKRNFIGFEMDEKIYKVAEERIKKVETII